MSAKGGTRVGILPAADREAIFRAAQQLQLDPYELGAFLSLESGPNMDPNIRGGAGKNYYGLIQFGPNERSKYLDPRLIGNYTRAEQMPKVVQYLLDRGFKPGKMGVDRAYATVLLGNPHEPLTKQDSFGTSPANALPRFKPGGDLYANARRVLGDPPAPPRVGVPVDKPTQIDIPSGPQQTTVVRRPPEDIFQNLMQGIQKVFGTIKPPQSAANDYMDQAMALDAAGQTPEAMQYYEAALNTDAAPTQTDNLANVFSTITEPAVTYYLDAIEAQKQATGPTTQQVPAPTAAVTNAGNQQMVSLVDLGKRFQNEGLRVGEQSAFGPVGKHSSEKSLHYKDLALDITDWNPGAWKERTKALGELSRKILGPSAEIFHPGYDPVGGHESHLHFGLPSKYISADAANQLIEGWRQIKQRYPSS